MKILLINPNRYTQPPSPPLALEYLAASLAGTSHSSRLLDLTFSSDPLAAITGAVAEFSPDVAGITVRNIDSAVYHNNLFFLDEIAGYVKLLGELGLDTIAGGAGFSFAPREILKCLGARWGVDGPGEGVLAGLLDQLERGDPPADGSVLDGWSVAEALAKDMDPPRLCEGVNYERYLDEGAVAGFRTQAGCRGSCPYCSEANLKVVFRPPEAVVRELRQMTDISVHTFHLCDSEFNQDLDYCHRLLEAVRRSRLDIDWALYMKAAPFDEKLFRELAGVGASLITFTYPTGLPDEPELAGRAIALARACGIRVAVDYLCGFPGQSVEDVARELDILRNATPDTVGVSNCIRLYQGTATSRQVCGDPRWREGLLGEVDGNPGLLRPVFYSGISLEKIRGLVAGEPLFKIEGFERSSNYQRLSD